MPTSGRFPLSDSQPPSSSADAPVPITVVHLRRGAERAYEFAELACSALHEDIAKGFAARIRGVSAPVADSSFRSLKRFLAFLEARSEPFACLADLHPGHVHEYGAALIEAGYSASSVNRSIGDLSKILRKVAHGRLATSTRRWTARPVGIPKPKPAPPALYCETELRAILAAAHHDALALRTRFAAFERERPGPGDGSGTVQECGDGHLTPGDVAPLLILGTALTALTTSMLKNLPAAHRLLDNHTVVVLAPDRRGGIRTVHWSVGRDRDISTPGGWYLLVHRLAERSRQRAGSNALWSLWTPRSGHRGLMASTAPYLAAWAERHELTDGIGQPMRVGLARVRTTVLATSAAPFRP
ncbi:hypothetical protein [Actinacidiphila alni]|uniref:hypothetical protein n=1 Tax=Actinacidiphila alni TaxID=380248 RepID=UPI003454E160